MKIKLICFDLFGTLYNGDIFNPEHDIIENFKLDLTPKEIEQIQCVIPLSFTPEQTCKTYLEGIGVKTSKENMDLMEKLLRKELKTVFIFPETMDLLKELKSQEFKLALISNFIPYAQEVISKEFFALFDFLLISNEIGLCKPSKAIFGKLKKDSGIKFNEMIMVGDSFNSDIAPAKSFGMKTIWIAPNAKEKPKQADIVVKSLSEVSDAIKKLVEF
jgi:HAD superfamily hydrolase (TIGR01549 family)